MKSIVRERALFAGAVLLLSGCGVSDGHSGGGALAAPAPAPSLERVSDTPVILGEPYSIGGVSYTPADIPDYDDVGYASVYGEDSSGKPTANGEMFDPAAITAAHKTLPLPSYVEVTALDTGRTILVRVNDRGPMANDRLIDLSRGAAAQLGIADGPVAVRVRRTNPPQAERAELRAGRPVPERIATPDALLAILRNKLKSLPVPKPVITAQPAAPVASGKVKPGDDRLIVLPPSTKPDASATGYLVQVGAFSSEARANTAARAAGGKATKVGNLWHVRIGPFATDAEARSALGKAKEKGFRDALIIRGR